MKVLLIDDMRTEETLTAMGRVVMPTVIARTYDEAIALLQAQKWDLVYLDHDLGHDEPHKTGYGIMNFLEANTEHLPGQIDLVTCNPVGRKNMQLVVDRLYK